MNSIDSRRRRVEKLYALKRQVESEIKMIEQEIDQEIHAMKRARKAAAAKQIVVPRKRIALCGTDGGYFRHRRTLKEDACEACKLAHRVAEQIRRQNRNGVSTQVGEPS